MKQKGNCIKTVKPFLRWAGGKTRLINELCKFLPESFNNYHEPFLGGGAFFFYLNSTLTIKKAFLNDTNRELINSFKQIKSRPKLVLKNLFEFENSAKCYYNVRKTITLNKIELASRFIYLNRTSFNGIYRVNRKGEYNVPFGNKRYKKLVDVENIKKAGITLKNAHLSSLDFFQTIKNIKKNDLVFIDPPYTVAHEKNGFIEYNQNLFKWEDQERLLLFIKEVDRIGAYYIMTNAAHSSIKKLFKPIGSPFIIERYSVVGGGNSFRGIVNEYIFSNVKN